MDSYRVLACPQWSPQKRPDAFQGTVAEGELELADQTAGSEGRELSAEGDDLLFDFGDDLRGCR